MKTLEEIKNEVAAELGKKNWSNLLHLHGGATDSVWDMISKRFAIEVAKQALKNADKRVGMFPNYRNLVEDKILNESNIPTL